MTKQVRNVFDSNDILQTIFSSYRKYYNNNDQYQMHDSDILLSDYIKQLEKIIESSKVFIGSIVDQIRYKGKIKIINTSNENPTHPQYLSTFPDLMNMPNKDNSENDDFSDNRFNETFDLEGRKQIFNQDENFKKRMEENVKKTDYNNFIHENQWQVFDQVNSLDNINYTIQTFQNKYRQLQSLNSFEESFMMESNPFVFIINDHIIPINTRKNMMESFEKIIPNVEVRRLISTYANKKILRQSYLQFLSEHPDIQKYEFKNLKNTYNISYLNDGSIKLVATHTSDIDTKSHNSISQYKSYGIRATIIFNANNMPIIKYSYFLK